MQPTAFAALMRLITTKCVFIIMSRQVAMLLAVVDAEAQHDAQTLLVCLLVSSGVVVTMSKVWLPNMTMTLVRRTSAKLPRNNFIFRTTPEVTKPEIKEYLAKVYGVRATRISTVNYGSTLSVKTHTHPLHGTGGVVCLCVCCVCVCVVDSCRCRQQPCSPSSRRWCVQLACAAVESSCTKPSRTRKCMFE